MAVYNACVVSTLLYGSETWTTYARQERRLNSFHLRSLRRILGISWQDKVFNTEVLTRAGLPSMYTQLRQRGKRTTGRPHLRYKDVCKRDMKALDINTKSWEALASDRSRWKNITHQHLATGEKKLSEAAEDKRARRKVLANTERPTDQKTTPHICDLCGRDCHSLIGLFSHKRRCSRPNPGP